MCSSDLSVGEGSDHLQLIKFLADLRPREGGLRWGENFWLRLSQRAAFASLRALSSFTLRCLSVSRITRKVDEF